DADTHQLSFDLQYGDYHVVANLNLFVRFASQDEHEKTPSRLVSVATPLAGSYRCTACANFAWRGLLSVGNAGFDERSVISIRPMLASPLPITVQVYKSADSWFYNRKVAFLR